MVLHSEQEGPSVEATWNQPRTTEQLASFITGKVAKLGGDLSDEFQLG